MAETANVSRTIDPTIRAVTAVLGSMPEVARAWPSWSEDAQVDFYLEWDALMDHLGEVTEAYDDGRLNPDQLASFRELAEALDRVSSLLDSLDLQHPRLTLAPAAPTA
jgi:hypothetical protein